MSGQGLEDIKMEGRESRSGEAEYVVGEDPNPRTRNHQDTNSLNDTGGNGAPTRDPVGEPSKVYAGLQSADGPGTNVRSTREDARAGFYDHYRREAEEYDKEFMKRHDEDLNTTLIFAGLFSAVASTFITQVQPQLQPDPNDETNALLRILIYNTNSTAFGDNIPTLPQWTGPPRMAIQVQCILYASLAASLLSAFLAMLGKQWLNRYVSVNMRGSAIERSQNRQRKLDGIVTWYFDHVLELLPLMLQLALLLLGCALSRYLWEIDTATASVVLGVTSFGVLFYLFIVTVGAVYESCPYQTPWANVVRCIPGITRLVYALFVEHSFIREWSAMWWHEISQGSAIQTVCMALACPPILLLALAIDTIQLGRATFRPFVTFSYRAYSWLVDASPALDQVFDNQIPELDFRCFLWMFQTSLDKTIKASTLGFLGTILPPSGLDSSMNSAVLADCFNTLGWFVAGEGRVTVITSSLQQLAMCFLRAFSCLSITEPTSTVIRDIRQRYRTVLPLCSNPQDPPYPVIMAVIHHLFYGRRERQFIDWRRYNPPTDELVSIACALAQVAQFEYRNPEREERKVPRWLLRFALRFLSQDPPPPTSVIADCLAIIATDLGRDVSAINSAASDENARLEQLFASIQECNITDFGEGWGWAYSFRHKAAIALLPYAAQREGNGTVLPLWLKYATMGAFTHGHRFLRHASDIKLMMEFWIGAASAVPYTDYLGFQVTHALFGIASSDELLPHIPVPAWDWLNKRPSFGPANEWSSRGTRETVVQRIRELDDVKLTVSYLSVVWSPWSALDHTGCLAMRCLIREDLSGIEFGGCRADLIRRLDYALSQGFPWNREEYEGLRTELLEVDDEATKILTRSHSTFVCALPLPSL